MLGAVPIQGVRMMELKGAIRIKKRMKVKEESQMCRKKEMIKLFELKGQHEQALMPIFDTYFTLGFITYHTSESLKAYIRILLMFPKKQLSMKTLFLTPRTLKAANHTEPHDIYIDIFFFFSPLEQESTFCLYN